MTLLGKRPRRFDFRGVRLTEVCTLYSHITFAHPQVLRDAVSEKNGLMVKSKERTASSNTRPPPKKDGARRNQTRHTGHDASSSPSVVGMPPPSIGTTTAVQPYYFAYGQGYAASYGYPPTSSTSVHPSVTPGTQVVGRKRPRSQETPMDSYAYPYHSSGGTSADNCTPDQIMLSTPVDELSRPSISYPSRSSSQHPSFRRHSPPSAIIPEHYASGVGNEPWLADVGVRYSDARIPVAAAPIFDPYNEDILSDHSDHRDGAISPIPLPTRGSDHRDGTISPITYPKPDSR